MNRKRLNSIKLLSLLALAITLFAGCTKTDLEEELLYGTWYCADYEGGFYYTFDQDHSGSYRDTNGDGKTYNWKLLDQDLEITVNGSGVNVSAIETYVIESLSASKLVWYDQNDPSRTKYTYTK